MPCDRDGQKSVVRFSVPRKLIDAGQLRRALVGSEQSAECECRGIVRIRVDGISQVVVGLGDQSVVSVRATVLHHTETAEDVERKIMFGDGSPEPKGILNA